jgi:hypothetical protein
MVSHELFESRAAMSGEIIKHGLALYAIEAGTLVDL